VPGSQFCWMRLSAWTNASPTRPTATPEFSGKKRRQRRFAKNAQGRNAAGIVAWDRTVSSPNMHTPRPQSAATIEVLTVPAVRQQSRHRQKSAFGNNRAKCEHATVVAECAMRYTTTINDQHTNCRSRVETTCPPNRQTKVSDFPGSIGRMGRISACRASPLHSTKMLLPRTPRVRQRLSCGHRSWSTRKPDKCFAEPGHRSDDLPPPSRFTPLARTDLDTSVHPAHQATKLPEDFAGAS